MNAEGYARALSPEMVAATSTGFAFLAAALWLVLGVAALWRRTLWQRRGVEIVAFASAHGGVVAATIWGFRVVTPSSSVEWRYGVLDGPVTRGVRGKQIREVDAWVDATEAAALVTPDAAAG